LEKCKKIVYLGHHQFLTTTHSVIKKGKHFRGVTDHRPKPELRTGDDLFDLVRDLEVIFEKGPGGQSVPNVVATGHAPMWKKKSIFWELEYWKNKRYTKSTGGSATYERPKQHASTEQDG
jgi:hypothetical protein